MNIIETNIPDVKIIEPTVYGDERGFFMETWNQNKFDVLVAKKKTYFVQDNHSFSSKGTIRGLHYQSHNTQGKLVRVISGEVYDVAVDLRKTSETFGKWVGVNISSSNQRQLWVPEGFAHGFIVTSDIAHFLYKCTNYYSPENEHCIRWNDDTLNIDWPIKDLNQINISSKDARGLSFIDAIKFE